MLSYNYSWNAIVVRWKLWKGIIQNVLTIKMDYIWNSSLLEGISELERDPFLSVCSVCYVIKLTPAQYYRHYLLSELVSKMRKRIWTSFQYSFTYQCSDCQKKSFVVMNYENQRLPLWRSVHISKNYDKKKYCILNVSYIYTGGVDGNFPPPIFRIWNRNLTIVFLRKIPNN